MTWRDVLFRIGLYRGTRVASPADLIQCSLHHTTHFSLVFETAINEQHHLAHWLFDECEGPWAVGMQKPFARRKPYVVFARPADALMFRILSA
jgi:hypothetical protein